MLHWYAGIETDIVVCKQGKYVVLHADENMCRLLISASAQGDELNANKFIVGDYPSIDLATSYGLDYDKAFQFNGRFYLHKPAYFFDYYHEDNIQSLYEQFCENDNCQTIRDFLVGLQVGIESTDNKLGFHVNSKNGGYFSLGIVVDGITLSRLTPKFGLEPYEISNFKYRVNKFDVHQFVRDVRQTINQFDTPPDIKEIHILVSNIMLFLASSMSKKNILFRALLDQSPEQ